MILAGANCQQSAFEVDGRTFRQPTLELSLLVKRHSPPGLRPIGLNVAATLLHRRLKRAHPIP